MRTLGGGFAQKLAKMSADLFVFCRNGEAIIIRGKKARDLRHFARKFRQSGMFVDLSSFGFVYRQQSVALTSGERQVGRERWENGKGKHEDGLEKLVLRVCEEREINI